ncbi:hypothetical protein RG47T_4300 [Mucilaginibacter polytrichastri]|uniref:Uncharacterized protein n=1 Tax=Mucilaginibacter polytrichastri TaxID=1302689 RepID=A0A1Q6A491_9SPHI|nr:hypothetical protein RG47T_4300 [Mucilaginibacter polytrichastri]
MPDQTMNLLICPLVDLLIVKWIQKGIGKSTITTSTIKWKTL